MAGAGFTAGLVFLRNPYLALSTHLPSRSIDIPPQAWNPSLARTVRLPPLDDPIGPPTNNSTGFGRWQLTSSSMPRPPASPSPPPATLSFSFMSGNYDYPTASTSPPPAPRDNAARHAFHESVNRAERERASGAAERDHVPLRRPRAEPLRRRAARRAMPSELYGRDTTSSLRRPPPPSYNHSTNSRPRATPSERYLRRSHARMREQRSVDMDTTPDSLDSLADIPMPNPFTVASASTSARPRSPTSELGALRRQTKRRKLEHDSGLHSPYDGFKYGHKGQVVPGRLKMEIVSCDGGEYDKHSSFGLYPIQNVLKNDKSVYCSERSRCNLLLKHIGEMPFTLEKVVIKAPDRGFTAPYVAQLPG